MSLARFLFVLCFVFPITALAEPYVESNQKIAYLKDTGFGPEEQHGAVKLDTYDTLEAACLWDIILFDPSTAEGKQAMSDLNAALSSNATLKSISFTKDPETADCLLVKYQL